MHFSTSTSAINSLVLANSNTSESESAIIRDTSFFFGENSIHPQRLLELTKEHPFFVDDTLDKTPAINEGLTWLRSVLIKENANLEQGSNNFMSSVSLKMGEIQDFPDTWTRKEQRKLKNLFHPDRWMSNGTYESWNISFLKGHEPKLILVCAGYSGGNHPWQPIATHIFKQVNNLDSKKKNKYGKELEQALSLYAADSSREEWKTEKERYVVQKIASGWTSTTYVRLCKMKEMLQNLPQVTRLLRMEALLRRAGTALLK
jgi:hypothetical protein